MALEFAFVFPLKNGLHARPASLLQDVANAYRSTVTFVNRSTGASANGKSTLSLVGSVTREGDPCAVIVEGEDEGAAYEALRRFLTDVFPGCDEDLAVPAAAPGRVRALPRALKGEQVRVEVGTPVSKGIARASAVVLTRRAIEPPPGGWAKGSDEDEVGRVTGALRDAQSRMRAQVVAMKDGVEQAILKAHLSIAGDPDFSARVEEIVRLRHCSAGEALIDAANQYNQLLAQSGSAYLQERILDIQDVTSQLIAAMYGSSTAEKQPPLDPGCDLRGGQPPPIAVHCPGQATRQGPRPRARRRDVAHGDPRALVRDSLRDRDSGCPQDRDARGRPHSRCRPWIPDSNAVGARCDGSTPARRPGLNR